jgi:hypothetical protein
LLIFVISVYFSQANFLKNEKISFANILAKIRKRKLPFQPYQTAEKGRQ